MKDESTIRLQLRLVKKEYREAFDKTKSWGDDLEYLKKWQDETKLHMMQGYQLLWVLGDLDDGMKSIHDELMHG